MTVSVRCPSCKKHYRIEARLAGHQAKCKACGTCFRIPSLPEPQLPDVQQQSMASLLDEELPPELEPGHKDRQQTGSLRNEPLRGSVNRTGAPQDAAGKRARRCPFCNTLIAGSCVSSTCGQCGLSIEGKTRFPIHLGALRTLVLLMAVLFCVALVVSAACLPELGLLVEDAMKIGLIVGGGACIGVVTLSRALVVRCAGGTKPRFKMCWYFFFLPIYVADFDVNKHAMIWLEAAHKTDRRGRYRYTEWRAYVGATIRITHPPGHSFSGEPLAEMM